MTLATRYVNGNNSGPYLNPPKVVVMHSTRSGQDWTDTQELNATVNWFTNPAGASAHWVLSETERVRVVKDDLIAWHSAYLNSRSRGIELTQPLSTRPFRDGHYDNAALIGRHYVSLGVAPVWLSYWDGGQASGFVDHADTKQGRESGKSDAGQLWDRTRFIASLEPELPPEPEPPPAEPPKEESMVIVIIKADNDGTQYILNTDGRKYRLGSLGHRNALNKLASDGAIRIEYREVSDADIAAIPDEHA